MSRGRLIFPFVAEISRLDTAGTAADPDASGPETSGYDSVFREPTKLPVLTNPSKPTTTDSRKELESIEVRCQIEPESFEVLSALAAGRSPESSMDIVCHFKDLELANLVDLDTGEALIRVGDRLVAIKDKRGNLVRVVRNPPGLFAVEVRDLGFGLGQKRNLLLVRFEAREQGS